MIDKIKVLQLQPHYNVKKNSASDLAEQIVIGLMTSGCEVTSAFLSGSPKEGAPVSLAQHSYYFNIPEDKLNGTKWQPMLKVHAYLKANKFDVVICNQFKTTSIILQLNKLLKIPLCIGISHTITEYDRIYRQLQIRFLADKRWQFIGVSEAVKASLIAKKCGFTQSNTHAITNAIDTAQMAAKFLNRSNARQILGIPLNALAIGAIGRLVAVKGHRYLINAFAQLTKEFPDLYLVIIGNGREEQKLKEQAKHLQIADKIIFPGFLDDAFQYTKAFDIWAMPSIREGLGLALLEGMCAGLPIVASDIPAMQPIIEGAGGIAVPPGDSQALASALREYLLLSDQDRTKRGEACYQYVARNHNIQQYRQQYIDLIEKYTSC